MPAAALTLTQRLTRPGGLYFVGALPALWLVYLAFGDMLGPEPIKALEHSTGLWALRFLIASLAITPLRRLGGPNLIRYRRALGLLSFFYALLHLTIYLGLDQGLDWTAIWKDIVKRPYITIGMAAFAILLPLAITSNTAMIRRLGGAAWQKLHRWVYVAAPLAALHFAMIKKTWQLEPLIYLAMVLVLLLARVVFWLRKGDTRATQGLRPASQASGG